jgi:hypothetical protein
MAKLDAKERRELPDSAFALPGRKYPIPDKSHARDALVRASEGLKKGWITKEEHTTIARKANSVLGNETTSEV